MLYSYDDKFKCNGYGVIKELQARRQMRRPEMQNGRKMPLSQKIRCSCWRNRVGYNQKAYPRQQSGYGEHLRLKVVRV
jgi:hypothetical protein